MKSIAMSSLVAVCVKWNLRFDLIDIPQRNVYKRAHDDHPHHLAFIFSDDPEPILLVRLLLL